MKFIDNESKEQIEIESQYAGYLKRQREDINDFKKDEELIIPHDLDYKNVGSLSNEIVEKLTSLIDACRIDLGDEHTSTVGLGRRAGGRVDSPATLTQFDPTNPVLWAEYDTDEFG